MRPYYLDPIKATVVSTDSGLMVMMPDGKALPCITDISINDKFQGDVTCTVTFQCNLAKTDMQFEDGRTKTPEQLIIESLKKDNADVKMRKMNMECEMKNREYELLEQLEKAQQLTKRIKRNWFTKWLFNLSLFALIVIGLSSCTKTEPVKPEIKKAPMYKEVKPYLQSKRG